MRRAREKSEAARVRESPRASASSRPASSESLRSSATRRASLKSRLARLKARRGDALALGVVFVFFAIFFGRLLLPEGLYPVTGDSYFYSYPLRVDAWRMIRAGQLPLWTPHVMSGYPLLSMAQLALGYPLTWGHLVLPGHVAETIYILAPFLLAPSFTYFYARETGRTRLASLLAALAFGWGGGVANGLAHSGMMTNAVAWLPLLLVAIERARDRPFVRCLLGATAAYSLCVLNGHAQGFTYVGALAAAYAAFISISVERARAGWARWRPLAVGAGALLFGAGLCAFQIMETLRATRRSVRAVISYETFVEGSLKLDQLLESMALPLFSQSDVSAYVAPLAVAFALAGAWLALRPTWRRRDPRPAFWSCAAVVSFFLMLGGTTPLYRLAYYVPVVNRFRVPARHSFEWAFALAALAAYGFDLIASRIEKRRSEADARDAKHFEIDQRAERDARERGETGKGRGSRKTWRIVAALASVVLCAAVGFAWHRAALAGPSTPGSWSVLTESQFAVWKIAFSLLTLAAASLCLAVRDPRRRGALVTCALVVAFFFEPLICYGLWWRYVRKPAARFAEPAVATRLLRSLTPEENRVYTRVNLFADETIVPPRVDAPDLSALRELRDVAGYEPLTLTRYARALADDYAGAHASPSDPAPDPSIFGGRSRVLDLLNATYVVTLPAIDDPRIKTLPRAPRQSTSSTSPANSSGDAAPPNLSGDDVRATEAHAPQDRWEPIYDEGGLLVVRNRRSLPRAWLVAEAEPVDGEEALRRIRGGGREFDPRRTALLEDAPAAMPQLPGGEIATGSAARVVAYEPSRIVVETDAPTQTLLILSEMFYPGWEATVDGREERIHLADYLLRAVPVPAGAHRVEMRYRAPQARNGLIVSAVTLLMLAGLVVFTRRRRTMDADG